MFEYMGDRISKAIKNIKGMGKITEDNITDAMREIRMALLEADVNYEVVKEFVRNVKEKALGMEVSKSLKPDELFIKLVKDELVTLLGTDYVPLETNKKPTIVMMVGLQGSGKTTTVGKLSNMLRKKYKKNPLLVACDVYRPAAIDQLVTIGKELNITVFNEGQINPLDIVKDALTYAKENNHDYIIIDTAGRLHVDEALMDELKNIKSEVKPHEILLVVDSMTGQDAVNVAQSFNDALGVDGVILTKLDGDTRGGAALSIRAVTQKPIKFIGMGEKLDDLEPFHPDRMASRILGMGDILSLIEKAQENIDLDKAKELESKIKKQELDFEDFLEQMEQIQKMGPLNKVLEMIPGMGSMKDQLGDIDMNNKEIVRTKAIVQSMTKEERRNPSILNASRKKRIARGSGTSVQDVNRLIKQFNEMKKMMKMFTGSQKSMKKRGSFAGLPFFK